MIDIICGFLIGALSLIPGISSDLALIALDKYEEYILLLSNIKHATKKDIFLLIKVIIGIFIGIFSIANILEYLFLNYPKITLYSLIFLIVLTLPNFYKKEIKTIKFNKIFFMLGLITILVIYIIFNKTYSPVVTNYPKLTIPFLITFSLYGMLDGILTITPGISGSMIMMMLNVFYLYKSYVANIWIKPIFILPLSLYLIGDCTGLIIGSKINAYFLKKYRSKFLSLIWGFVIMSLIIIFF